MVEVLGRKTINTTLLASKWQIALQRGDNHKSESAAMPLESARLPRHSNAAMHSGVLAMVVLSKILDWSCSISTVVFVVMAAFRLYQSLTGNYGAEEAIDDPLGHAIVYLMIGAVFWILRISVNYLLEDDTN